MAELTFRSPGVSTREIDLSGPRARTPQGTPAGVVGTATRGPAFVPVTFPSMTDFVAKFGETDGKQFGPLAMNEWFKNAQAGTYLRVLGIGDGLRRSNSGANAGKVTNAGFVVGGQLPQANGNLGDNASAGAEDADHGLLGRTYFLGAFMSESAGSTVFQDAGLVGAGDDRAQPILRGILMAPSGVMLSLKATNLTNNTPLKALAASHNSGSGYGTTAGLDNGGGALGDVDLGDVTTPNPFKQEFIMLINGLNQDGSSNALTASFEPVASNYFGDVFNTDPTKIEEKGHVLYRRYDVYRSQAVVTGTNIQQGGPTGSVNYAAFLVTSSLDRDAGSTEIPNFENFEDRFTTAFSPYVISQEFGGADKNLFRFHTLDDGAWPNHKLKISVENIAKSTNSNNNYGTFDVVIRRFEDDDRNVQALEQFRGLTLDPTSDRFIARVIGDQHLYYDFDQRLDGQKLVLDGNYPNGSQYVRVELSPELENGELDDTALPVGYRGPWHLVTSGTTAAGNTILATTGANSDGDTTVVAETWLQGAVEPPIPYRSTIAVGLSPKKRVDGQLYWGTQFEPVDDIAEPNKNNAPDLVRSPIQAYTNYMPLYHTTYRNALVGANEGAAADGSVILDADTFNNNKFTLERVQILTGSTGDVVDSAQWAAATYRRNGTLGAMTSITASTSDYAAGDARTRFLDVSKDFGELASKQFFKFSFFVQGGHDGLNIFDTEKKEMSNLAAVREMDDTAQGGQAGSTVGAFRKAIDVMSEKTDADIQLLAIPGIRETVVTDYAIEAVEGRFDAMYIMDIEEYDAVNSLLTGSLQTHNVRNTVTNFKGRALDSSFAAAYYPDVVITDPTTQTNVQVPPSVGVLGVMALNDRVAHPWFAPAGFSRGALDSLLDTQVKLNRSNLDQLYDAKINPIVAHPGRGGPAVFGQKTLLAAQSALDRVNVRRLLIDIRRQVRTVANTFIFEPNREETLSRFSAAVTPILLRVQQQQGLDRFKVQIDTTTTTQADVENNTVRGKIFLQPTRSVEFIALDFVVTNAGAEI